MLVLQIQNLGDGPQDHAYNSILILYILYRIVEKFSDFALKHFTILFLQFACDILRLYFDSFPCNNFVNRLPELGRIVENANFQLCDFFRYTV